MPNILQVAQVGHPILQSPAKSVENIAARGVQDLIDDMLATVEDMNGAGIAATQVYRNARIFIMASKPSPRYPHAPEMEPLAVINPEVQEASEEKITDWEGCLSIPGIRAKVPRHQKISVSYFTREGEKVTTEYEGFLARVFQHEMDHLEGRTLFNHVDNPLDIYSEKEYLRTTTQSSK